MLNYLKHILNLWNYSQNIGILYIYIYNMYFCPMKNKNIFEEANFVNFLEH
jgi:hypothetical protein